VTCFCYQSRLSSCMKMAASPYTDGHLRSIVLQVFIQEHKACEVSLLTHSITCFITSLPFLLLLPCLVAIVVIPLCGLNSSGITSFLLAFLSLPPPPPFPSDLPNCTHHQGMLTHHQCMSLTSQIAYPDGDAQLYHKICSRALAKQPLSCFCSLGLPSILW